MRSLPRRTLDATGRLRQSVLSESRCGRLKAEAWFAGGMVEAGLNHRLECGVRFQGHGRVRFGREVVFGYEWAGWRRSPILLQPRSSEAVISIGNGSMIMNGCQVFAMEEVTIGDDCRIGSNCVILDGDFHGVHPLSRDTAGKRSPVKIGNRVWLGVSVIVLKGVTIGDDAVVGAGAVVARSIEAGAVVVAKSTTPIGTVWERE